MSTKEKILTNIKTIRESKNFTEEYVATRVGISQSTYNRKENGESDFSLPELLKLGDVLEVAVTKLIDMDLGKVIQQYNYENTSGNTNNIEHQTVNGSDEGFKKASEQFERENEFLKEQVRKLTDVLIGKVG